MICTGTLSKTRLQRLRGYGQRETHAAPEFPRNHKSVTVAQRNRSMTGGEHPRNRARGYIAYRLQKRGYGQTVAAQGFNGRVTAVTAVTTKKTMLPNLHHFNQRLTEATAEAAARDALKKRTWRVDR